MIASPNQVGYLIRRDFCVAARLHLQSKLAMSPSISRRQDAFTMPPTLLARADEVIE
jgi:hypothetical protein